MGKVWMPGGGGSVDLDMVTAGKSDVLAGKVIVDKNGEPLPGTMPNRGALNPTLNAGESYSIPDGYHSGAGKVIAKSLASQTPGNADAGTILSGQTAWVNGSKVNGAIPWQNAEIAGTDQMWAQNYSNWGDGNYFLGVKNGYYLNGVNWVRGYNANFVAGNIKKGVNVAGVVGTFEGYVPTATDLYLRGNNIKYFGAATSGDSYVVFDSGQITLKNGGSGGNRTITANNISFTGYNYINFEGTFSGNYISISTSDYYAIGKVNVSGSGIWSIDIRALQATITLRINFYMMSGACTRIWLS